MKKYFLPSSLFFYLFFTLVFFIIGTAIAGISEAGEGQGLAAGAIVLGYGLMVGVLALVASVLLVRFANKKRIVKLNQVFGALFFILIIYLIYRYNFGLTVS